MSLHAKTLVPLLLAHAHAADRHRIGRRSSCCAQWNFDASGDSAAAAIFEAWFLQLAPTSWPATSSVRAMLEGYRGRFSLHHAIRRQHADAPNDAAWCDDVTTAERETCDEAVTAALHEGVADLTRAARRRHDALAMGRRAPRGLSASGARLGRGAAAAAQPLGAERRRLEHGERRRRSRSTTVRAARGPRLPARSSICRRPTTAASSMPSGSPDISCRRTTTIPGGLARGQAPEDADGARPTIEQGALGHLRLTPAVDRRSIELIGIRRCRSLVLRSRRLSDPRSNDSFR